MSEYIVCRCLILTYKDDPHTKRNKNISNGRRTIRYSNETDSYTTYDDLKREQNGFYGLYKILQSYKGSSEVLTYLQFQSKYMPISQI